MGYTVAIPPQHRHFEDIHAIIFDKDGTLENSKVYLETLTQERLTLLETHAPGIREPLAKAFGWDGQGLDSVGLMAVGSRQENIIAAAAYLAERGRSWFDALTLSHQCFDQADRRIIPNAQTCPMFPGVKDCFAYWTERGVKVAILSAARQWSVERFIADHDLGQWVAVALGSDQGLSKPDPALYHLACDKLGVSPAHTLMIGDAHGDMSMAKRAGAAGAIAIAWPGYHAENLPLADLTIHHLNELS